MSNALYNINRWDPVIINNTTDKYPMIYIIPDKTFLDFVDVNNNIVYVTINNTNSIYDNKKIVGMVRPSYNTPNCRVNFYNSTGLYTIILFADWHNYPDKLGNIIIQGLVTPDEIKKEDYIDNQLSKIVKHEAPSVESTENYIAYNKGLNSYQSIIITLFILIFLIILIFITYFKKIINSI